MESSKDQAKSNKQKKANKPKLTTKPTNQLKDKKPTKQADKSKNIDKAVKVEKVEKVEKKEKSKNKEIKPKSNKPIKSSKSAKNQKSKKIKHLNYATGKRKSAIAKVWLLKGNGKITVNKKDCLEYFQTERLYNLIIEPLKILKLEDQYNVKAQCLGGGISGQADALKLGISKALQTMNPENRPILKAENLLTRDSRVKERKKYGRKKARKGYQYRKR